MAVTRTLLEEGARVVAAARRSSAELDSLAGANLLHVPVDLMDPEAPGEVAAREGGVRRARHPREQRWGTASRGDTAARLVPGRHRRRVAGDVRVQPLLGGARRARRDPLM